MLSKPVKEARLTYSKLGVGGFLHRCPVIILTVNAGSSSTSPDLALAKDNKLNFMNTHAKLDNDQNSMML